MRAFKEQDCPRCDHKIQPGQDIYPTPRGWAHLSCAPGGDDE